MFYIQFAVSDIFITIIINCNTANKAWDRLGKKIEKSKGKRGGSKNNFFSCLSKLEISTASTTNWSSS